MVKSYTYKGQNTMKNGTGCGCGCIKSMTQSNVNSSNHIDPFKAVNYNNSTHKMPNGDIHTGIKHTKKSKLVRKAKKI